MDAPIRWPIRTNPRFPFWQFVGLTNSRPMFGYGIGQLLCENVEINAAGSYVTLRPRTPDSKPVTLPECRPFIVPTYRTTDFLPLLNC